VLARAFSAMEAVQPGLGGEVQGSWGIDALRLKSCVIAVERKRCGGVVRVTGQCAGLAGLVSVRLSPDWGHRWVRWGTWFGPRTQSSCHEGWC
jgi:hypothetical protein